MRKKNAIEIEIEKATQRADHSFVVGAIFLRQKVEAMRFKIDERIANDQCAAIIRMIKRELAFDGAIDFDGSQGSDLKTLGQGVVMG
jgi:hypothetical protein